jgi:hypothetical protein
MGVLHHIHSKKQQKYSCVQHAAENTAVYSMLLKISTPSATT